MKSSAAVRSEVEIQPEQMLIGLVLADPNARGEAFAKCRSALLRDPFHRRIFEASRAMHEAGEGVTSIALQARMKGDPAWKTMPANYLESMRLAAPVTRNVSQVIDLLRADVADGSDSRTLYTLKSVLSLGAAEPPGYLAKGLFAPDEISVIYGEPGSGKSFLASWASYRIAIGQPVFGRRVRGSPVVYAALEGQIGFERRLHALRDAYGPARDFFWINQPADLHSGFGDVEGLIDAVLQADAKMLVIDTLARAMGAGSENEGRDMGMVIAALDQIRRETGAHVAIVHHCGKDRDRGMRGHSSLLGAADMAFEIKRGESGNRTVRIVKAKDGKDGDEFGFSLDVVDLGQDDDGDAITTCIVVPCEVEAPNQAKRVPGAAKAALALLDKAVAEAGEEAPATPHIPAKSRTIRLSVWRRYCDQGLIAKSDKPDTKYKTFVRATEKLQEAGLIGIWVDFAWRK